MSGPLLAMATAGAILAIAIPCAVLVNQPACDACADRAARAVERKAGDKWTEAFASVHPGAL